MKMTTTHLLVCDLQRRARMHELQRTSVDHQRRMTRTQNSSSTCRALITMELDTRCIVIFYSRLLGIEGRQGLLSPLYRPEFRHILGRPHPSTPHDKLDLFRLADVAINQVKALRENDKVSKFAYGHRAEGFFKTKCRCCFGSCSTDDLCFDITSL